MYRGSCCNSQHREHGYNHSSLLITECGLRYELLYLPGGGGRWPFGKKGWPVKNTEQIFWQVEKFRNKFW